jgi:hypothetical protein
MTVFRLWDIRALTPIGSMDCQDKIYAMDVVDNRCVVGTKDKQIYIWDVRNLKAPMQKRESPLKVNLVERYMILTKKFSSNSVPLSVSRPAKHLLSRRLKDELLSNTLIRIRTSKKASMLSSAIESKTKPVNWSIQSIQLHSILFTEHLQPEAPTAWLICG